MNELSETIRWYSQGIFFWKKKKKPFRAKLDLNTKRLNTVKLVSYCYSISSEITEKVCKVIAAFRDI